ncbi:MAG: DeoR/GlpR family DNA-binding transcription regulator [Lachnospiraceae bacterium]
MLQERRNNILEEVQENGSVKVADLSAKLQCSEVTIRNDIKHMDEQGLLKRTHGGAMKMEEVAERKYTAESIYRHTKLKKQIAACAYEYINDRDTIIIDDASSSFYLAEYIKRHTEKHLAIVTNSLLVGNELAGIKQVELFMVGGTVGGNLAATMGDIAVENLRQFHVDKAFIGVHGINFDVGLTSIATPQMQVKKAILKAAQEVYVLADSSKFGGGYLSVICPLHQVHKIITDDQVKPEYIKRAEKEQVSLVISK